VARRLLAHIPETAVLALAIPDLEGAEETFEWTRGFLNYCPEGVSSRHLPKKLGLPIRKLWRETSRWAGRQGGDDGAMGELSLVVYLELSEGGGGIDERRRGHCWTWKAIPTGMPTGGQLGAGGRKGRGPAKETNRAPKRAGSDDGMCSGREGMLVCRIGEGVERGPGEQKREPGKASAHDALSRKGLTPALPRGRLGIYVNLQPVWEELAGKTSSATTAGPLAALFSEAMLEMGWFHLPAVGASAGGADGEGEEGGKEGSRVVHGWISSGAAADLLGSRRIRSKSSGGRGSEERKRRGTTRGTTRRGSAKAGRATETERVVEAGGAVDGAGAAGAKGEAGMLSWIDRAAGSGDISHLSVATHPRKLVTWIVRNELWRQALISRLGEPRDEPTRTLLRSLSGRAILAGLAGGTALAVELSTPEQGERLMRKLSLGSAEPSAQPRKQAAAQGAPPIERTVSYDRVEGAATPSFRLSWRWRIALDGLPEMPERYETAHLYGGLVSRLFVFSSHRGPLRHFGPPRASLSTDRSATDEQRGSSVGASAGAAASGGAGAGAAAAASSEHSYDGQTGSLRGWPLQARLLGDDPFVTLPARQRADLHQIVRRLPGWVGSWLPVLRGALDRAFRIDIRARAHASGEMVHVAAELEPLPSPADQSSPAAEIYWRAVLDKRGGNIKGYLAGLRRLALSRPSSLPGKKASRILKTRRSPGSATLTGLCSEVLAGIGWRHDLEETVEEARSMGREIESRLASYLRAERSGGRSVRDLGDTGLTPKARCCTRPGGRCQPGGKLWEHPTWQRIGFEARSAHRMQYRLQANISQRGMRATVSAVGDPFCSGVGRLTHIRRIRLRPDGSTAEPTQTEWRWWRVRTHGTHGGRNGRKDGRAGPARASSD
jgi:hypothetical protein